MSMRSPSPLSPISPQYKQSIGQRVKEIIIQELRDYFRNVSQFGFPGSTVKMPVIREAYGMDIRSYPSIFIKINHVNPQPMSIGQDFVQDVWSDDQTIYQEFLPGTETFATPVPYRRRVIAKRWGFMGDISFSLQVWGDTTPIRNRVVDETIAAFKFYQRQSLLNQGIVLMSIAEGEESDYPLNDTEYVYIANINLTVNAELYFDEPVASITAVNVIGRLDSVNVNQDEPTYIEQNPQQ